MSKPKHRAPSAGRRQWLLWTITAAGIPVVCTALAGGGLPLFTVLAACFTSGTIAADVLLGRPTRRLPVAASAARVAPAPPATHPRALPGRATRGNASPAAQQRRRDDEDAVTLLRTSDHVPEITLVPAAHPRVPDPAETAAAPTGLHERERDEPGEDSGGRAGGTGEWPRTAPPAPREPEPESGGQRTLRRETAPPHPGEQQAEPDGDDQHPFPGAVWAKPDGRSPDRDYRIKGNVRSKRYHTMQSPYYERTKATVWFRSAAEAEQAGFSPWNKRLQNNN